MGGRRGRGVIELWGEWMDGWMLGARCGDAEMGGVRVEAVRGS